MGETGREFAGEERADDGADSSLVPDSISVSGGALFDSCCVATFFFFFAGAVCSC